MKKQIKKCAYICLLLGFLLLTLAGCGAKISTRLSLNGDFAGERVMTCVVAKSDAEQNFEGGLEGVEQIIAQYCPTELTYEKTEDDASATYIFTLSFQSFEDYQTKVEAILGRESKMVCRRPDSVFSSGLALEEDFDSRDLLGWFQSVVVENSYMSDVSNLWELSGTAVVYNGEEFSTSGAVQFDCIVSNPVSAIHMNTAFGGEVRRTITFEMPAAARDARQEQIDAYMDGLVPAGGTGIWEAFSEGYQYTIAFQGNAFGDLQEGMSRIFGGGSQLYTEIFEDDPFVKTQAYEEHFNVYAFGDASSGALYFDSTYTFDDDDAGNRYVESFDGQGRGDGVQYVWERYTGEVDVSFQVVDRAAASNLSCTVTLNKQDAFDAVLELSFPAGQTEEVQRAANYYQRHWEDITVETLSGDAEICRVSLLDSQCPVTERLNAILGSERTELLVTTEKGFFKSTCEIVNHLEFHDLSGRAGISSSAADYTLKLDSYKLKSVNLGGYEISDIPSPYSIEETAGVYLTASASKMNPVGILLILLLIAAAAAGLWFAARRMTRRGEIADYSAEKAAAVLTALRGLCSDILHGVRTTMERYYPEGANRRLTDYFYGSRWPFLILLGGLIGIPLMWWILGWFLTAIFARLLHFYGVSRVLGGISPFVVGIQALSIPVSLIWMIVDKVRPNPAAEAEYDRVFQDDLENFKQSKGLDYLCLTPEQVSLAEPLKLVGPDYDQEEARLPFPASLLRRVARIFSYRSRLIMKYGADGKIRYSCAAHNIWYFSENQMYRYEVKYDLCTSAVRAESTCETFYQDLTVIRSCEKTFQVWRSLFKKLPQVYQSFIVTTESGHSIRAAVDSELVPAESVTAAASAMQNLARDRKAACENKKNFRRTHL